MIFLRLGRFTVARVEWRVGAVALGFLWHTDKEGFSVGLLIGPFMPAVLVYRRAR